MAVAGYQGFFFGLGPALDLNFPLHRCGLRIGGFGLGDLDGAAGCRVFCPPPGIMGRKAGIEIVGMAGVY